MSVTVRIPAQLASFAHRSGEESEAIVYLVARALDRPSGTGRVAVDRVVRACSAAFSAKQIRRVLEGEAGMRYWSIEGETLVLRASQRVLASFELEPFDSAAAISYPLEILHSRPRRGAALFAAIVATPGAPRSWAFIARFAGVDRGTVRRWRRDPAIRRDIFKRVPQWAVVEV